MAAFLSQPHCVFVFVFVFDELYLYLYLYLIRFFPVYLYLYLYLKLRKKMYLYLIKRIWPQPWTHWGITTLQMNSSVFKPHEWAPFQSNYNFTLTHDQYKVECLYNAVTFVKILHSQRCQNAIHSVPRLHDYKRPLALSQGMDMASVHSALGSGYGETNLTSRLLANVPNISICGSPHLANTGHRLSMAIVHSVVRVWPTLDRESAWILHTPGRWTGTNVIALLSHHLSSRMVFCIKVCDLVPPSFLMYATITALSDISHTARDLRWGRKSLTA